MGRAKNSLKRESISSVPVKFRYFASYASSSLSTYGITSASVTNIPYNVTMSSAQMEKMNTFRMIRQLYYNVALTGSMGSASFYDPMWQSTAASGSGIETTYYLPTGSSSTENVLVFAIPSSQFGEQIARQTFNISSSGNFNIVDDGNGNLIDALASNVKVGNIFYAQGIAVITNPLYTTPGDSYLVSEASDFLTTEASDFIILE